MILEIDKAFTTNGYTVFDFFQRPGMGLYIPLYQREYSWDSDNINQLIEDITKGIEALCEDESKELRFLGTIISIVQGDKTKIDPIDTKAIPTAVEYIIDGQQRLTTLALFGLILYDIIEDQKKKFKHPDTVLMEEVEEACNIWQKKLINIFSLDLGKGKVKRKPQIIRGHLDRWIKDGEIDANYRSDLSNLLAKFLNYYFLNAEQKEKPNPNKDNNVGKNYHIIRRWLTNIVLKAHSSDSYDFIPANTLIDKIKEEYIWSNERPELRDIIQRRDDEKNYNVLCGLIQIFAVCHYLIDRCCFTHIVPLNEDWAFDMFQSLNASGTPLTAIETFKPLVVNSAESNKINYKDSEIGKSFERIEQVFTDSSTAAIKSKKTNELITSFRIVIDGKKIQNHFSEQRKWLNNIFNNLEDFNAKEHYIKQFGYYSEFLDKYWLKERSLDFIQGSPDYEMAEILFSFLKESKHNMAITILGILYMQLKLGYTNGIKNFIKGIKFTSGFYSYYRSLQSNSGLDDVYRRYFEGNKELNWGAKGLITNHIFDIDDFGDYLKKYINVKFAEFENKTDYISKTVQTLRYNKSKSLCKLALFVSSHDTIPDETNPGLLKQGVKDSCSFLTLNLWKSEKLSTIEHIAPQNNSNGWDDELYNETEYYDSIGNLTLLPISINSSVGNKDWQEKFIYYMYLSAKDLDTYEEIKNDALQLGVRLNQSTLNLLEGSPYHPQIESIIKVGIEGQWDIDLVKKRSHNIIEFMAKFIFDLLELK